ncbi:MAG: hypothetical protein ACW99Q_17060, partial [Candidatus Kariarchaeaceae archaeon]
FVIDLETGLLLSLENHVTIQDNIGTFSYTSSIKLVTENPGEPNSESTIILLTVGLLGALGLTIAIFTILKRKIKILK